ncbi:hypothetical protein McpSp1_07110 [Methanocorpusculaceae archaeon Sp1]|nr:hypothetical protein [Methanocorpusculaceae archaeon Sp1]
MRSGAQNEDAVSPTIATILLIAIAVVLVVIVTGVVMGAIGGEQEDTKFVEIYMLPSGENAFLLTVMGGYDADTLVSLNAYINGVIFENNGFINNPQVGIPHLLKVFKSSSDGSALFTLVGTFEDGTVQMLYQRPVTVRGVGVESTGLPKPNDPIGKMNLNAMFNKLIFGNLEIIRPSGSSVYLPPDFYPYTGPISGTIKLTTSSNNKEGYIKESKNITMIFYDPDGNRVGEVIPQPFQNNKNDYGVELPSGLTSGSWCYMTISGEKKNGVPDSITIIIRMTSSTETG